MQLSVQIDQNIPHSLILDALKVKEIITNLIQNGIKFTQEGYVKVIVRADETNILKNSVNLSILVEDSGIVAHSDTNQLLIIPYSNLTIEKSIKASAKF